MELSRQQYRQVKRVLEQIYKYCGTYDPFLISKKFNINVSVIPLKGLSGISDISPTGHATIYLSSALNSYAKKIVCAHELGHIFLHRDTELNLFTVDGNKNSLTEYEANIFALELLPHIKPINYFQYSKEELQSYIEKKVFSNIYTLTEQINDNA